MIGKTGFTFSITPPFQVDRVDRDPVDTDFYAARDAKTNAIKYFHKNQFSTTRAGILRAFIRDAEMEIELAKRELEEEAGT